MKIFIYAAAYVSTVLLLVLLNYILSQLRRAETERQKRLEVARWRSFLPPGDNWHEFRRGFEVKRPLISHAARRGSDREKGARGISIFGN